MEYNIVIFKRLYPVLQDFLYHYINYKEMIKVIDELPGEKEFWVRSCDANLKIAVTSWCMIFGAEKSNPTHWKRVCEQDKEDNIKEFRKYILNKGNLNKYQWDKHWNQIVSFRNRFIVHRELDFNDSVPYLETAKKVAIWFDLWIREKIKPDYLDFETLERLSIRYADNIRNTLVNILNKNY